MHRLQRGQAMVIIALTFGVLCGMVGLAVDGGRAFVDRRAIQNAADAAAMSGASTYIRTDSFTTAEQAMLDTYARNRDLTYTLASACDKGWQAPPAGGSVTLTCSFNNDASQHASFTVTDFQPPSSFEEFSATGTHSLLTALIQIVGAANSLPISGTGCAATWNTSACAAVPPVVLATSTLCGTSGDALKVQHAEGSTPAVVGNVGSYGSVNTQTGSPQVAGDVTWVCGDTPSPTYLCYPSGGANSCGSYPTSGFRTGKPPLYNLTNGTQSGTAVTTSGLQVNLTGGVIDSTTVSRQGFGSSGTEYFGLAGGPYANPCYFLSGGVYTLKNVSLYNGSGVVSNELRPPDEPDVSADPTTHEVVAAKQLWNMNGSTCAGSFTLSEVADTTGFALPVGDYAIRLTSVRYDSYGTNSFERESAPSACKTASIALPSQGLSINVSNVPGAQDYNVYVSSTVLSLAAGDGDPNPGKCNGYFYQLATIPVQNLVNETNADTSQCPSAVTNVHCTLGVSSEADLNLCTIDRVENLKGLLSSLPVNCSTLLSSIPDVQPQPAFSCSASAYVQVPPPKGTLKNPPISHSCGWPGPYVSCTGGSGAGVGQICFNEFLAPADASLPDQDEPVNYESANWGVCYDATTLDPTLCPNQYGGYSPLSVITPGAVQFQADSGGCFTFSSTGYPFVFSGYQYSWGLLMHTGPTSPACSDTLDPYPGGQFVGHYYGPTLSATVYGTTADIPNYGPQAPTVYGCFIANQPTVDGSGGLAVYFVTPTPAIAITGYGVPTGSGC